MTLYPKSHTRIETMKWKAMLVFFLLLLCQNTFSQFYWQKTYRSPLVNGDDEAFDGCYADGGNFYAVGSAALGSPYFFVLKINEHGDTIWTKTFGDGRLRSVTPDRSFGCVVTGLRGAPFSINLNSNGSLIWDKTYSNADANDITRTNDSGYILCAGIFSGYVCKLDTAGNLQWEKTYSGLPVGFATIELAIDGGYVIGGRKFVSGSWKAYFMKIDGAGNILWEKTYNYVASVSAIAKKTNGYIFVSSTFVGTALRTVLLKTDITGNLLLADTLLNNSLWDSYPSIVGINSNKFIISFHSDVPKPAVEGSRILSIDSGLNVINELVLQPFSNSINIYKVIKAPGSTEDDIICIGSAEPNGPSALDVYIARIDSSLNQPPPILISTISIEIPIEYLLFQNYPNPFNPVTYIKFSVPKSGMVTLIVYDVNGKEISKLIDRNMNAGSYNFDFDASRLSSGVYFYRLSAGGFSEVKKMILLK